MNKVKWFLAGISLLLLTAYPTGAARSQCSIRATPIGFGAYDVFLNTPLDTTGTITVECQPVVANATITLSASPTSGTFNPRRMKRSGGNDRLDYNVYVDIARTVIFGDGTGATRDIRVKKPTGKPEPWRETVTIHGRIPPGQDVSAGVYTDLLTATIDF